METFLAMIVLSMITLFSLSAARDTITPTRPLADNETLVSAGGTFALGFFNPTNSTSRYIGMWYNKVSERRIVWVANRAIPIVNSTGLLSIAANGTLMITDQKLKTVVWSISNTSVLTSPSAQLLDTGNFVLKQYGDDTQNYDWQSFDHPADTMLSGMKLGLYWNTGFTVGLTAWKSDVDPSVGEYRVEVENNTDTYLYSTSGPVWRSGPWDGMNFRDRGLNYSYVNNSHESTFSFVQASNDPMILVTNLTGKAQLYAPSSDSQRWDLLWEEPTDKCNTFGHCGPNGVCNNNTSPMCSCLTGYAPKNPSNWASGVWTEGCTANTELNCRNGTDAFVALAGLKLPESSVTLTSTAFTLDQCRLVCLQNCSCTGYAMDGGRQGCVNWYTDLLMDIVQLPDFDETLYLRVASSYLVTPTQTHKKKHKNVIILVSLLVGILVTGAACIAFLMVRRKTRNAVFSGATKLSTDKSNDISVDGDIPLFDFATIEAATDCFSPEKELGQGGFGTVYKGELGDGQLIAVKRLATTSLQGITEFKNEVNLIAKLQNKYLVRLLGCCIQDEERMLIYEYMPNKSLDAILFDKEKGALLDWRTRYQIIIGIARGLLYLHHDSLFRIIHRDLKASNILLDNDMNPKISDFGMARIFGGDETDFNTRKIVGTYGYMSPEYAMEGIFSLKSDVYSFGVLVLEIITGRKNRTGNAPLPYLNLVAEVWSLWTRGESLKLVDGSMSKSLSANAVLRCIKVGLLCVQENPDDRPLMSSVIVMLGADITSLPEPKQPGFAGRIGAFDLGKGSSKQDSSTSNELTITVEGR